MGYTGYDDLTTQTTTNAKTGHIWFNRTIVTGATSVAGRWHECLSGNGTGGAMTLTGTAGAGIAMNRSTAGALPLNANVASATRHLQYLWATTPGATVVPGTALLTDLIHIYPSCVLTGTPTTLSNHPTWTGTGDTRMSNAVGVQCSLVVTTAGTAGNGALTPTYLNQAGSSVASPRPLYAPSATAPAGCLYNDSGVAVTVGGPFMPLGARDTGVQRISSYTIGTGLTSGVGAFILHRPIAEIPLNLANLASVMGFVTAIPTFPRIYDDACLGLFILVGGALTTGNVITGHLAYGWGG